MSPTGDQSAVRPPAPAAVPASETTEIGARHGTDPDPGRPEVTVMLGDRDLIQAARLQARHRQANRAQIVAQGDNIPGYTIKRELHRGGQGVVYFALRDATGTPVAIKVIRDGSMAHESQRERFNREVRVLAQINHANIVSVIDSGQVEGSAYLVMDFVDGRELAAYVEQENLSVEDTVSLFIKVCDAVNAAHVRGVIHRDLKPANIMVDGTGEPKVLDFGLAKLSRGEAAADGVQTPESANTQTGQFVGSLPFASPEQAIGDVAKIDTRTDVYSLGVILYRILTGEFPYSVVGSITEVAQHIQHAEPVRASKHRAEISEQLDTILLRALAKSRGRRYQSVPELASDLSRCLQRETIDAKRDGSLYQLVQIARRNRVATASVLAFLLALLLTSAVFGAMLADRSSRLKQAEAEREELRQQLEAQQPAG